MYLDVAGWHLYLRDVKVGGSGLSLAQGLAAQLGAQIDGQGFRAADVQALLKKASGGGRVQQARRWARWLLRGDPVLNCVHQCQAWSSSRVCCFV